MYQKDLHDLDNHDDMITHPEPDILECEVKWALGSITMNQAVATGLEKVSFHSNPKERQCQRMLKLLHKALISHASKIMLKILQARLQQYVNHELPDVQGGFRKGRGTRDQIANICWIMEKAREFQKNIYF